MEAYHHSDEKAETVAIALIDQFITRFGLPMETPTDQGRDFESWRIQEMCALPSIHKIMTTPFGTAKVMGWKKDSTGR